MRIARIITLSIARGVPSASGEAVFTPSASYRGADSFTYKVSAADGTSNTATVSITVTKPGFQGGLVQVVIPLTKFKVSAGGKLGLHVHNNNSFVVVVTSVRVVSLKSVTADKHHRPSTLGSSRAAVTVAAGATATVTVSLKPAAMKLLRRLHHIRAQIVIIVPAPDGSTGTITTTAALHAAHGQVH